MKTRLWFTGLVAASFAAFLGWGGDVQHLAAGAPSAVPSLADAASAISPTGWERLHWPSMLVGMMLGVAMAVMARVSWLDMPRRFARWLVANERNFYRVGMAAACLMVLIFY